MLHAPRQTGKTTFLLSWARELNTRDDIAACYVTVERAQGLAEISRALPAVCEAVREAAKIAGLPAPPHPAVAAESLLSATLQQWAALVAPKSLVVLFDEVDVLEGEALVSFLRQLRGGFATRAAGMFPTSVALVGMRDLKDYLTASKGGVPVNPGSPFNIKQDSAVIGNFSEDDVARLFAQRTAETGQQIAPEALAYVYDQSRGQPWIVNSLFMRATMRVLDEDSTETVTLAHVRAAREQMVLARETHLDALAWRMENPGIRRIMETLIAGETIQTLVNTEEFRLCLDLGLMVIERGTPQVANPLYREVLARQMAYAPQMDIPPRENFRWQKDDGTLDMDNLLREFQGFWQENSEMWEEVSHYTEAFPHLLLMAFLQRVTNGEGRIEREYAAGRGRMDLAVEFHGAWNIIEVKLLRRRQTFEKVRAEGLRQILAYRDCLSSSLRVRDGAPIPCHLIIFDRRDAAQQLPWDRRVTWEDAGAGVTVLGC
jgi:hypothetical protein